MYVTAACFSLERVSFAGRGLAEQTDFVSMKTPLPLDHGLKMTLQPSLLARTSVNDFSALKTETPFESRSGSIVRKVCNRRTTTYEASKRANSSCTSQVSRWSAKLWVTYDRHKARHTTKIHPGSSIEREVTSADVLQVQTLNRILVPSLGSEGFSVLAV